MTDLDDDVQSQATSESSPPNGRTLANRQMGRRGVFCDLSVRPSVCPSAETSEKISDTRYERKRKSRFELQPHVVWFYSSTF